MKSKDIVISGFDYAATEKLIDAYTVGIVDFRTIYVTVGAHREDNLICHLRIGEDIESPYIPVGKADVLCAKTREDAKRNICWISESGTVCIKDVLNQRNQ